MLVNPQRVQPGLHGAPGALEGLLVTVELGADAGCHAQRAAVLLAAGAAMLLGPPPAPVRSGLATAEA
jgi:hypothetical protein